MGELRDMASQCGRSVNLTIAPCTRKLTWEEDRNEAEHASCNRGLRDNKYTQESTEVEDWAWKSLDNSET